MTIAGGQHFVDDNIREALEHGIDYLVLGEGEVTIKELLETLRAGRRLEDVRGIAFLRAGQVVQTPPRELITDFDLLPRPDFSLVMNARIKLFPVGWVRGCGMNCEFCTVKGKVRCPAPEYALNQITTYASGTALPVRILKISTTGNLTISYSAGQANWSTSGAVAVCLI